MKKLSREEQQEEYEKTLYRIRQKAIRFKELFQTDIGRKVLVDLEEEFNRENIVHDNPYTTHYNLGKRDVLVYIHQMIREANREEVKDG